MWLVLLMKILKVLSGNQRWLIPIRDSKMAGSLSDKLFVFFLEKVKNLQYEHLLLSIYEHIIPTLWIYFSHLRNSLSLQSQCCPDAEPQRPLWTGQASPCHQDRFSSWHHTSCWSRPGRPGGGPSERRPSNAAEDVWVRNNSFLVSMVVILIYKN